MQHPTRPPAIFCPYSLPRARSCKVLVKPPLLDRLATIQADKGSVLCVGLDPDPARLPAHLLARQALPDAVLTFNAAIIEATAASACAFKLNFAFFEALGADGWRILEATLREIPATALTIADAKRGDIGNSARFYAKSVFEDLGFDAVTVSPYMGRDSVEPFLAYENTITFVLGRTSNPGAADFQVQPMGERPLFLHVAEQVAAWGAAAPGTAGLVVGATDTDAMAQIRQACPDLPLLIPGVGAQGGDAEAVRRTAQGGPIFVNSSRQILYASGETDFAEAAAREATRLRTALTS